MEKTDINRLHQVYTDCLNITLAACHLAGQVSLGDCNVICLINKADDINSIKPIVEKVFKLHGMSTGWLHDDKMISLNLEGKPIECEFISRTDWVRRERLNRGYFACIDFEDFLEKGATPQGHPTP